MIYHGDCIEVMATLPEASVDAIVTDPPYGLLFMGKSWDHGAIGRPFADAMYRVAKPSAYLLAFGGTRTVHRMTCALEDAGWIIRDMLVWGYASGFPKGRANLKPAWEPIVMARKPGPLRMLAIDECRIGVEQTVTRSGPAKFNGRTYNGGEVWDAPVDGIIEHGAAGRWPANVVLTDPIFDGGIEGVVGGGETSSGDPRGSMRNDLGWFGEVSQPVPLSGYGDTGTYSRFFLIPKAARSDREPVLGGLPYQTAHITQNGQPTGAGPVTRQNVHPTVKPVDLMRHLVRLVTPTGGVVLDPFLGSGTTAIAADLEGFDWIGIEKEAEYVDIAKARLNGTQKGLAL